MAIARPTILAIPLFLATEVTNTSLSPTALNKSPDFVLRYQSRTNLTIITKIVRTIIYEYFSSDCGIILSINLFSNILSFENIATFAEPAILKLIAYRPVITIIPDNKSLTLNTTCIIPVTVPAIAPANNAASNVTYGLTSFTISIAVTAAPNGNVLSTDKSGKSNILYVI